MSHTEGEDADRAFVRSLFPRGPDPDPQHAPDEDEGAVPDDTDHEFVRDLFHHH